MLDTVIQAIVSLAVLVVFLAFPALLLAEALGGIAEALYKRRSRARLQPLDERQMREYRIRRKELDVSRPIEQTYTYTQKQVDERYKRMKIERYKKMKGTS